jgi:hypothetical protein
MINQNRNWNKKRSTYLKPKWKGSVSAVANLVKSHRNTELKINQRQNGLLTKANKAMLKQERWNKRYLNLH